MKWTTLQGIQDSSCFLSGGTIEKTEKTSAEIGGESDPRTLMHVLVVKSNNTYLSVTIMCWLLGIL